MYKNQSSSIYDRTHSNMSIQIDDNIYEYEMITEAYENEIHGKIVNIKNSNPVNTYFCMACGRELIGKRGDMIRWHYSHKAEDNKHCREQYGSCETIKHIEGKRIIREYFDNFTFSTKCQEEYEYMLEFDKEEYEILEEKGFYGYVPDLQILNSNKITVFIIEVVETHASDLPKIYFCSNKIGWEDNTFPFIEIKTDVIFEAYNKLIENNFSENIELAGTNICKNHLNNSTNIDILKKKCIDDKFLKNKDQLHAIEECMKVIKTPFIDKYLRSIIINGPGGTGKTEIILEIIKLCAKYKILILTPTHAALNVLRQRVLTFQKDNDINIDHQLSFSTIDKAVNSKARYDKYGNLQMYHNNLISSYDIYIFDEISMIHTKFVNIILEALSINKTMKILCFGDENQLPPVQRPEILHSEIFNEIKNQINLSKILRVSENRKDIIKLHKKFINHDSIIYIENSSNITMINKSEFETFINKHKKTIDKEFEHSIILAFTNKTVDNYNELVKKIYKKDKQTYKHYRSNDHFEIGNAIFSINDILVLFNPEKINIKIEIPYSNTELEYKGTKYKCDKNYDNDDDPELIDIYIPDNYKSKEWKKDNKNKASEKINEEINKEILHKNLNPEEKSTLVNKLYNEYWKIYHNYLSMYYPPICDTYSRTIHKSQGGQWANVIIDIDDIKEKYFLDDNKKRQLLYVAMTRAQQHLYCIVPDGIEDLYQII